MSHAGFVLGAWSVVLAAVGCYAASLVVRGRATGASGPRAASGTGEE